MPNVASGSSKGQVEMTLRIDFRSVRLSAPGGGEDGCLVLVDDLLSAILVRLAEDGPAPDESGWYLEIGFPPLQIEGLVFPSLAAVETWMRERLSAGGGR